MLQHAIQSARRGALPVGALLAAFAWGAPAAAEAIRFAYIGDTGHSAWLGARQGLEESNLQGRFLGREFSLDVITPDAVGAGGYTAYVLAGDAATLNAVASRARNVPVFNVTRHDDELRAACIANVLHVIPSQRMMDDAVAQWRRKNPGAAVAARAWHEDFVKFAARDLNKRFLADRGQIMDDYSWAGWAAVRMAADSMVRGDLSGPGALLNYLKTQLAFDGQKGTDMNFRITGQLRQIMLLISEDNSIAGEAPVRGVVDPEDVDSLGISHCTK